MWAGPLLLLALLPFSSGSLDLPFIAVDANRNLELAPPSGKSLRLNGVDVPSAIANLKTRLAVVERSLNLTFAPLVVAEDPVSAICNCSALGCAPAVTFADNRVECCASDNGSDCRWAVSAIDCRRLLLSGSGTALRGTAHELGFSCVIASGRRVVVPDANSSAWIGVDRASGDFRFIPVPGRTVVAAGLRILEWLAHMQQRIVQAEAVVFGANTSGAAFTFSRESSSLAGFVGMDGNGDFVVNAAQGKRVLFGDTDVASDLTRSLERVSNISKALASCPCLATRQCLPCSAATGCGAVCNVSVELCATNQCDSRATCSVTGHGDVCTCNAGWTSSNGGLVCTDADECRQGTHNCASAAVCDNTLGSFICTCPSGQVGVGSPGACRPFKASNGTLAWTRINSLSLFEDFGKAIACDPAGRRLFFTGFARDAQGVVWRGLVGSYSTEGDWLWTQDIVPSPARETKSNGIGFAAESVFVCGYTQGNLHGFNKTTAYSDMFLSRYLANGTRLWTQTLRTEYDSDEQCYDLVADENTSSVYVAGWTDAGAGFPFGQGSLNVTDCFVGRYTFDGLLVWVKKFGTAAYDLCTGGIAVSGGKVYVVGNTDGSLPGVSSFGGQDYFIFQFQAIDGKPGWSKQFGTNLNDGANDLAVTAAGLFVTGYSNVLPSASDAFVVKIDHNLSTAWTQMIASSDFDVGSSVYLDASGNVFVAGYTLGNLGSETNAAFGQAYDAFAAMLSPVGTLQWTRMFGNVSDDNAYGITADASGAVYVTGGGQLGGQGKEEDLFILKFT